MGPSKPAMSDATFAFATQLYRNEAKALQTQLQFNRNVPAVPENLALRFSNPRPIIIEKLKASNDQRNPAGNEDSSIRSSGIFSVVSEERLKLAVQLAKRDIRQRHLEEQVKQQVFGDVVNKPLLAQKSQRQKTEVFESPESKNAVKSQTHLQHRQKLGQPSKVDTTTSGAKVYLYAPNERKLISAGSDSPPTRDTGPDPKPNVNKKEDKNVQEVRRLQKELRSCVQKIEELIKKGTDREILDPDKEQQICTRRQKQAARSARMLYVLQQQVKEIQDDLEKLSPHKIKHTKKSQAVSRLAAAHRGAVRALQAFAKQFTDQTEQQIPTHYKEMGSLIRQLSLCSAKLEVDSSISDIIIDILLQVEDLDSLLEKKQTPKKVKKCISAPQGKSPRNTEIFPARKQLPSPKGESKPLILKGQHRREPRKPPSARSLLTAVQKATSCAHVLHNKFPEEKDPPERNATSQGSLDALVRARTVKRDPILESGPLKKKGMLLPAKSQGMPKALKTRPVQPQGKQARFQETTIAFQLKENKRRKESSAPCVPPNPTSLPVSPKRSAWLEADTSGRVKALTDLSREEMKKIQKLRSQSASPTQCADKVEKAARECLEPVLDRTQVAANADILSEKLLDDLLEDTAQELWSVEQRERLQSKALPVADIRSLESMLQRMEEIERYQEAVRRRFTQIVYSDLEFQFQEGKMEQQIASTAKRPTSPHPIQITKLIRRTEPEMDIFFEKHFDGNDIDENKEAEEKLQTGNYILQPLTQSSLQRECYVCVSVPKHMLQSISDYNSRYQHHLKLISHEAVGSFDPWQIAERYMNCLCVFEVNVSADEEVFLSLPRKGVGRGPFKFQTESQKQSVNWTLSLLVFGVHGFLRQLDKTKGYGSRMSWRSDYFSHLSMVLSQKPLREIKGNLNSFQKTVISR
ncbi:protein moonraker isoform X2 [Egretta garzetta]|uniref:protein moonraker isoform X2 n=1 Tax=Egretta garzetta TaxID=188379 RepID=UPI00163CEBBE|nr:protein moonraker isoform X2 [Egretta garzetta]